MKKNRIILSCFLALVALVSCVKEETEMICLTDPDHVTMSFDASLYPSDRSVLQEDGSVFWNPGDEIMVINRRSVSYGYNLKAAVFTSTNTYDSATASFSADVDEQFAKDGGYGYFAVYPASAVPDQKWDVSRLFVSVPSVQTAVPGSYDKSSFLSFAYGGSDGTLHFRNICGGIRFRLSQSGISSVILRGLGNERLCTDAEIKKDGTVVAGGEIAVASKIELKAPSGESFQTGVWYYISTLPVELTDGFQLVFRDSEGRSAIRTDRTAREIKASVWGSIDNADAGLVFEGHPANEIQYTTSDGNPVTLLSEVSNWDNDYTLLSNECIAGVWHMVFDKDLTYLCLRGFEGCTTLKSVYLPDGIVRTEQAIFRDCSNLEEVHLPEHLEKMEGFEFENCTSLKDIHLPESLTEIGGFSFWNTGLTKVTIGKNIQHIGLSAFRHSPLARVDVLAKIPPRGELAMFGMVDEASFPVYVPDESANDYALANYWGEYSLYTSDNTLVVPVIYTSSDYSHDGDVIQLQKASVGKGVRVVILGDGFTDKEMVPGGYFEEYAREAMEGLFSREPLISLRSRFDVYAVKAVSANSYFYSKYSDRALTYDVDIDNIEREDKIDEYAAKVPGTEGIPVHIILIFNDLHFGIAQERAHCGQRTATGGSFSTLYINQDFAHGESFAQLVLHECAGHGLGYLGDEYIEYDGLDLSAESLANFDKRWEENELWPNLDWKSDPSQVRWARFITDERYKDEKIGVFEGGWWQQLYRPNDCSIMNTGFLPEGGDSFNAPGREAIYKRVMKQSEGENWTYDYETFVAFDAPGHEYAIWAFRYCAQPQTGNNN